MSVLRSRRPGEAVFSLILAGFSGFLLWTAYGIAGFEALSSPGALPIAAAGTMFVSALVIVAQTLRRPPVAGETLARSILPTPILVTVGLVAAYAVLLKPLGFVPTSLLFVAVLIRILSGRPLIFCAAVATVSVLLIYLVFRVVFNVIMPEGIIPERQILAAFRGLFTARQ